MNETPKPVCLTIAGSDSGGGAGIQADIKAIQANGAFAASVITAVTAQNTVAVNAAYDLPLDLVAAQIDAVCTDIKVSAVKTGMLSSREIIQLVAERIDRYGLHPLVVDPVMISKSGFPLLADHAVETFIHELLPLADLLTPNAHEAGRLTGRSVENLDDAKQAAERIHDLGCRNVLIKGGHLGDSESAIDILYDGVRFETFTAPRLATKNTHGTGCTYASAIAAYLARGLELVDAIRRSKEYVTEAIRHGLEIGAGHGPTDHFYFLDGPPTTR